MKPKIVKQESGLVKGLYEDIISKWDNLNEDIQDLDIKKLNYGIIGSLHFLLIIAILDLFYSSIVVGFVLLLLSVGNTVIFFTAKKSYQLFHYKATRREASIRTINFQYPNENGIHTATTTELHIWNPHPINSTILKYFSPIQVMLALMMDIRHFELFLIYGALSAGSAFLVYYLITAFEQKEHDQRILAAEVLGEQERFANRFMSRIKEDKSVQTGEENDSYQYVSQQYPLLNSPAKKTASLFSASHPAVSSSPLIEKKPLYPAVASLPSTPIPDRTSLPYSSTPNNVPHSEPHKRKKNIFQQGH